MKKSLILILGLCCLSGKAPGVDFSLKASAGWSWIDGGDLNASIAGWRRYYQDRKDSSFSASYSLKEMRGGPGGDAEAILYLSTHWSAGLSIGFLQQRSNGEIHTRLTMHQTNPLPPSGTVTVELEETTGQHPRISLETIPVTLTVSYSLGLRENLWLDFGVGAGVYWSKFVYEEDYEYAFNYTEEELASGTTTQYVEEFGSYGVYTEKTKGSGLGLHGRAALNLRLSATLFLTAELFGRWAELKNWEGEKTDAYEWRQTWGPWGAFSETGKKEEKMTGRLWRVDLRSDLAGGSYPRLIFSDSQPVSSSYVSAKPARFNLSGIGLRFGLGLRLGKAR